LFGGDAGDTSVIMMGVSRLRRSGGRKIVSNWFGAKQMWCEMY
jgi:hypothetical protein